MGLVHLPAALQPPLRREFDGGKDASEAARRVAGGRHANGRRRGCRPPAELKLIVLQKINTNHQLVFAALTEIEASIWCAHD